MDDTTRREIDRLASEIADGKATDAGFDRLDALLRADPECRQHYLFMADLHAGLSAASPAGAGELAALLEGVGPTVPAKPSRWKTAGKYGAAVLAAVAATLLVQFAVRPPSPTSPEPDAPYVATLIAADCEWDGGRAVPVGGRLAAGGLRLRSGVVKLLFDGGTTLLVRGPAVVRIESATAARVEAGEVVFENDDTADSFTLTTPYSALADLGTQYAVAVGPAGEEVHVFDGEVRRRAGGAEDHLRAGEARVFPRDAAGRPVAADRGRFPVPPPPADPATGLLAYDGFDYPAGEALTGGTGWAGSWRGSSVGPPLALNSTAGLKRPGAATAGGCVEEAGNGRVLRRQLAEPIRLDADAVYYFSCLFRRAADPAGESSSLNLILGGGAKGKNVRFGVSSTQALVVYQDGAWNRVALPLDPDRTYLLTGKLVAARTAPDQLFLRVYAPHEKVGRDEPGGWALASRPFAYDEHLDYVSMQFKGDGRQAVDEFRLGTTWASVAAPWAGDAAPAP